MFALKIICVAINCVENFLNIYKLFHSNLAMLSHTPTQLL